MPKYTIEGKTYAFDGKMTTKDARFIYEKANVGLAQFDFALSVQGQPDLIAAFMFLLKRRAPYSEAVKWEDVDSWDLTTFRAVWDDPKQLRADREILMKRLELVDEALAEADAETDEVEVEEVPTGKAADPTPSKSGTTRKRGTSNT